MEKEILEKLNELDERLKKIENRFNKKTKNCCDAFIGTIGIPFK